MCVFYFYFYFLIFYFIPVGGEVQQLEIIAHTNILINTKHFDEKI